MTERKQERYVIRHYAGENRYTVLRRDGYKMGFPIMNIVGYAETRKLAEVLAWRDMAKQA